MKKKKLSKYVKESRKELIDEHERIVPAMKIHGMKKEAKRQVKELNRLKGGKLYHSMVD